MKVWVIDNLRIIFPDREISEDNIDESLKELLNHSMKMVTFLARFARQFNHAPKIMDFQAAPCFETLVRSMEPLQDSIMVIILLFLNDFVRFNFLSYPL
ncbi:hypothetical protein PXH59_07230 [Xenorhabdus sp. SF857]|uniref:hypothetical protein n=1 Tax=Xenorhabdus bakwenae TaxID=3026967 RepID=UPI0025582CA6|nr:hypothetical protein [Xenorhabdus sp. SF857]WFQ80883.1 hypothetical protein PXH59_07230 [Xenorhabdus sp. SF857]